MTDNAEEKPASPATDGARMRGALVESRQGGARVRVPPPLVFLSAVVAGWLLPGLRVHSHHLVRIGLGVLLLLGGVSLGFAAIGLFRKTGQDPVPWKPTPELIFDGPYKVMRNPMYVGMTLLTLGISALSGHAWIALLAPFALLCVHTTAVLPEERYLEAKFGAQYTEYKTKVHRYF